MHIDAALFGSGMSIDNPPHMVRALAFDFLPEVRVGGEVDATEGRDAEFEDEDGGDDAAAGGPPVELLAEGLEERVVHRVCHVARREQRRD